MKKISNIIAPILTAIIFGTVVTILFTTISATNRIDTSFWITTLTGTVLTIMTTIVWFPVGVENGKSQQNFKNVTEQYNKRADYIVNKQLQGKLSEFCDEENEKFALKLLKNKLSKVCLTVDFFEKYKKHCIGQEISEDKIEVENFEKECKKLSKKQIKVLNHLRQHEIKFKKLTPGQILKVKNKLNRIAPLDSEKIFKTTIWTSKIIWSMCSFAVLAFIVVNPNTSSWISKLFQLGTWAVMIGFNIFSSLSNGNKSITEYRKNYLLSLSTKCAQFFEYANIPLSKVDNDEKEVDEDVEAKELG